MISRNEFEDEYAAHHRQIHRLVKAKVSNRAIAEEIAAQAWLKAWAKRHQYTGARHATFRTWVAKIAINLTKEHWRLKDSRFTVAAEEHRAEINARLQAAPTIDSELDAETLLQAIHDPKALAIMRLQYIEGWRIDDIAEKLKTIESTVKVISFRTRSKLRKLFENGTEKDRIRPEDPGSDGHGACHGRGDGGIFQLHGQDHREPAQV